MPTALADRFADDGTHLERYARVFDCVEINSSFHRPHRRTTYERWAASVPAGFRFAVKVPKAITHERRLVDCPDLLARFADEAGGLGERRGPTLVQLPPSLAFDPSVAARFFDDLAGSLAGPIVCEPRHPSWFEAAADALLTAHHIARVAADPARVAGADRPGGWSGLRYMRWHGAPQVYRSAYDDAVIDRHADAARCGESWTIYDNTAAGAAPANALTLMARLAG
nr:DUF72 domain-containing protein [Sphingomonas bacterium]